MKMLRHKIPHVVGFVKMTDFDTKTTQIEIKIPNLSSLVKKALIKRLQKLRIKYHIAIFVKRN